jgi:hypothetical protein
MTASGVSWGTIRAASHTRHQLVKGVCQSAIESIGGEWAPAPAGRLAPAVMDRKAGPRALYTFTRLAVAAQTRNARSAEIEGTGYASDPNMVARIMR